MAESPDPVPYTGDTPVADVMDPLLQQVLATLRERESAEAAQAPLLRGLRKALERGILELPLLNTNVIRVLELLRDDEVDLEDLGTAVETDPALATKVVGVANSAFFRGSETALGVRPALLRMGLAEARRVVAAVALRSSVFSLRGETERAQALWRHSALTGLACQALLEEHPPWGQSGFLLGLVHDVGRLAVLGSAAAMPSFRRRRLADEALDAVADAFHPELGALAGRAWGFPELFVEAVLHHHHPEWGTEPDNVLGWALYAADTVASLYARGWRPGGSPENDLAVAELLEPLGVDLVRCEKLLTELEAGFEALTARD